MEHLEELNFLIDQARLVAGSDARVAAAIGATRMNVSNWRKGKQRCPPKQQALLAAVAGLDPVETLARATVQADEGTELGDRLMRALGKATRATGAVLGFVGASALAICSLSPTPSTASPLRADVHNEWKVKRGRRNAGYVKRRLIRS